MNNALAVAGLTGKKSGGEFANILSANIKKIDKLFPGGIRALVRKTSDTSRLEKILPRAKICVGELFDTDSLRKYLTDVDTVINIADIDFSKKIVDIAAACNVRRVILVHTTGIYSKYKAAGEAYRQIDEYVYGVCKKNSISLTILRPTMIYGNAYDNNIITFIRMVDRLPIVPVVNGAKYYLQPVYYKDLAVAYYDVLINEKATAGKEFILSGGKPILLRDMFKIIGKKLGKEVKFLSCPFKIAYFGSVVINRATSGKKDYREKVQRLCESRDFPHEEATTAFGYSPVDFETGVSYEIKGYLESKFNKDN